MLRKNGQAIKSVESVLKKVPREWTAATFVTPFSLVQVVSVDQFGTLRRNATNKTTCAIVCTCVCVCVCVVAIEI